MIKLEKFEHPLKTITEQRLNMLQLLTKKAYIFLELSIHKTKVFRECIKRLRYS